MATAAAQPGSAEFPVNHLRRAANRACIRGMTGNDVQRQPMDGPLRLVIVLMFVNLGLSVVLSILMLILHRSLVSYELAHTHLPANASPAEIAAERHGLESATWGRLVGVVIVAALYIWRASALRRGSRGAYRRLILICVVGLIGIVYLITVAQYPVWMRVEQVLQGIVLLALLYAVTRPAVRTRYAKPAVTGGLS
jgi:Na+/melibiose symporter-like transporter